MGVLMITTMNKKIYIVCLFFLILPVFSTSFAAAQTGLFWWECKNRKKPAAVSRRKPVRLALCLSRFPHAGRSKDAIGESVDLNSVTAWIRSPDGTVSKAGLTLEEKTVTLDFPSELTPARLNGLYLACARMDAGPVDMDSDGKNDRVHYYAKYLICHKDENGIQNKTSDVFFKDAKKIPFEIGPLDTPGTGKKESCIKAGFQKARKKHRIKVLYNEKPLAYADAVVLTESGWEKRVKADAEGTFSITLVEDKKKAERCLYTATYKDPSTGEYHCSNLSMVITAPPPLWMIRAGGFDVWAVLGSGIFILYVTWAIYRKVRRDHKTMLEFEKYKIGRN
jgi:hypothetical protein